MLRLFALSLLTLFVGLVSLAHDTKKSKRTTFALGFSLVLMCGTEIFFGYRSHLKEEKEKAKTAQEQENLQTDLEEVLVRITYVREILDSELGYSKERAETASSSDIQQSLKAAKTLQEQIEATTQTDRNRRSQIDVQYFDKGFDENVVEGILTTLGFRPQRYTPELEDIPINAIWVSEDVPIEDAKAIANTLVRAGVELKSVRSFPASSSSQRRNTIQIGSDAELARDQACQPLTYEQIQSIQAIDRDNLVCRN
jgi:hypothetical protein